MLFRSSVAQACLTLCDPMDCSTPGLPVHHQPQSLLKLMSIELVMPSNHLILCHPLLLPPSIFPRIRVFSNESVLHIRWPKYWSFSFSISSLQSFSSVPLFATPRTAARQASLSITNSWSSLKLMSIELVMPSNYLILCHFFSSYFQTFPASGPFPRS